MKKKKKIISMLKKKKMHNIAFFKSSDLCQAQELFFYNYYRRKIMTLNIAK